MMKIFVSKCREFDTAAIETAAIILIFLVALIWHKSCVLHFLQEVYFFFASLLSNRTPSQKNIFQSVHGLIFASC